MGLRSEAGRSAYPLTWPRAHRAGVWTRRLQRVSGLLLAGFAVWHIFGVVGAAHDRARLADLTLTLYNPVFLGLLLANLGFHTLNGLRSVLFELGLVGVRRQAGGILLAALGAGLLAALGLLWRLR